MATSKLYPTLSRFYEENGPEFNTEASNIHSLDNVQSKFHEDRKPESANNLNTNNSDKKSHTGQHVNIFTSVIYPSLPESTSASLPDDLKWSQEHKLCTSQRAMPSAPPIELLDEDLIRFLENARTDQSLCPQLDETPAADYTILFDDTWEDDLQPDYDITLEDAEAERLNNLNKAEFKMSGEKLLGLEDKAGQEALDSTHLNILSKPRRPEASRQKDLSRHHRVHVSVRNVTPAAQRVGHEHVHDDLVNETKNRTALTEAMTPDRPLPGSPEYNAWMTWRKQVNRQLATVILLRRGDQVKLQQSDLSRKHLNKKSIDFVSNIVKPGNRSSLGGKPFVMYGIPRACLSPNQAQ